MTRSFIYLFILLSLPGFLHAQSQPQYRAASIKRERLQATGWITEDSMTFNYSNNRSWTPSWQQLRAFEEKPLSTFFFDVFYISPLQQYDSAYINGIAITQEFDIANNITKWRCYARDSIGNRVLFSSCDLIYTGGKVSESMINSLAYPNYKTVYRYKNGMLDSTITDDEGLITIVAYEYNNSGLLTKTTTYTTSNSPGASYYPLAGTVYEYDTISSLLSAKIIMRPQNNTLVPGEKFSYTYNSSNDLEEILHEDILFSTFKKKHLFNFDSNHNLLDEIIELYDAQTTGFYNYSKRVYIYNAINLVTRKELKRWNNTQWVDMIDTNIRGSYRMFIDYEMYWPTSITQVNKNEPAVKLYPSPSSDFIRIEAVWKEEKPFEAMICDMQGRVIRQWQEPANRFYTRTIPIPELPAGVYILKMECGEEAFSKQFVKQ